MSDCKSFQKHLAIGTAAVIGYHGVRLLYNRIRLACDTGEPQAEARWICPGVGILGGALTAGLACRLLSGGSECEWQAPPRPRSDLADLFPRAVALDPIDLTRR
jgi:hypothetical protein